MQLTPDLIERHCAFYQGSPTNRPLCDFFVGGLFPLADFRDGLESGRLEPELFHPECFVPFHKEIRSQAPRYGDLIETAYPFLALPWMEAIMGCPIHVSLVTYSIGSAPFLEDLSDLNEFEAHAIDLDNPWRCKLLEYQRLLCETFGDSRPVGLPVMRGPIDLAVAILGGERTVFEIIDHPREMEHFLHICAQVWIQTARAQLEVIPPFQGGYFNYRQLYFAGPTPMLQEDNVSLLSPSLYREFLLPQDQYILGELPGTSFHTHSSSAHLLLEDVLGLDSLRMIDSCWDLPPFGPPVERLLPSYHRVQEAGKSLYIVAVGCPEERDLQLLTELDPKGLCIFFEAVDSTAGHRIAERLLAVWKETGMEVV